MEYQEYWKNREDSGHRPQELVNPFFVLAGEINAIMGDKGQGRVLDIGCGAGETFEYLKINRSLYTGVDFSPEMIKEFRHKHPGVNLIQGAGQDLVTGEKYDFIFTNAVVQYLSPSALDQLVKNISTMMKQDGIAFLGNVPNRHLRRQYYFQTFKVFQSSILRRALRFTRMELRRKLLGEKDPIGYWYKIADLYRIAEQHGLAVEFLGSMLYPYRFHAVLMKKNV